MAGDGGPAHLLGRAARTSRREERLDAKVPDPLMSRVEKSEPAHQALLADVVLDTLAPAERLAFALHDVFGVPFAEIAPIVDTIRQITDRPTLEALLALAETAATIDAIHQFATDAANA